MLLHVSKAVALYINSWSRHAVQLQIAKHPIPDKINVNSLFPCQTNRGEHFPLKEHIPSKMIYAVWKAIKRVIKYLCEENRQKQQQNINNNKMILEDKHRNKKRVSVHSNMFDWASSGLKFFSLYF